MKTYLYIVAALILVGCSTVKEIPINTTKVDSVRVERVVEYRDTTIYVDVPRDSLRKKPKGLIALVIVL